MVAAIILTDLEKDRVIEMAWEDHILKQSTLQFGLKEQESTDALR
jgi:hypothetical protein